MAWLVSTGYALMEQGEPRLRRGDGEACGKAKWCIAGTEQGGEMSVFLCVKTKNILGMALRAVGCFL